MLNWLKLSLKVKSMSYVPLHVYSEYSFLKSGLTLDKYFSFAKKHNFKCLGICDYQVMFGFPIFF